MTTIAVRRLEDSKKGKRRGVVFASDDQVTTGYQISASEDKVFVNGPVVFGFAGSVRDKNLLQHALVVPKFGKKAKENPTKWVVTKLIPAIRKTLEDHGSLENDKGYTSSESHLIVAVEGACGYVSSNFAFTGTSEDMWSVGSGSSFALGAMTMGATPLEAVTVAGMHDAFTGGVDREVTVKWT